MTVEGGFAVLALICKKLDWLGVLACSPLLFEVFNMHWSVLSKFVSVDCAY